MQNLANDLEPAVPQEEIAAAEAETPTPEAPQQDAPQEEQKAAEEPKVEKLVSLGALHEERQKRKRLQAELDETRQRTALLEGRFQQLYEAQQPRPQEPDPNDPLAVLVHGQQLTQAQIQELYRRQQVDEQRKQQDYQKQQLVGWYQGQAAEFVKESPDFQGAYEHMRKLRAGEFQAMGYNAQQIAYALEQDELGLAHTAYSSGQNPAQIIYKMAQATGYKKGKEIPGEEKIQTLKKGVEASKSLGVGGSSAGKPTPEQIANMSESEFADFKASLGKKGQRLSDAL
jgi:hypothetical protein